MKTLMKYFKNYKVKAILAPLFKMLEASFELMVPLVMAAIIDTGIKNDDKPYIFKMALVLVGLGLIGLTCSITAQYFSAKTAMGFCKELRRDLFAHIESLSYTEIDKIGSSTLITRMTSDVNQVQTGVNMFLRLFMRSPFIVFGAMIMSFTVDAHVSKIFFVTLPVLILIVFGIMFVSIPLYKGVQGKMDYVTLKSRENLLGVRVIRAFNQEDAEMEQFEAVTKELTKKQLFVGNISSFLNPLTYAVINLSIAAIIYQGSKRVDSGVLLQGELYALVNYMSQILIELIKLANLIITETKAIACANRIESVFLTGSSQVYNDVTNNGKDKPKDVPKLSFKNAGLTYKGAKESSIEGITMDVYPGETVGIIGGTGSGKSSFVNLIPRFYDCTEGRILLDGIDVNEYSKEDLIKKVGVVPQRAVLFAGTIADNMRVGKKDASDLEIYDALEIAQAKDFVDEKDGKIEFVLNRGAKNLSGGQKQRLTIARALVKKPEVLILDDSSSALDYATDASLRKALREKKDFMTVFMVSQRASSIMHADKIVVLDDGKIVGLGRHEELLKNCEVYNEIFTSQTKLKSDDDLKTKEDASKSEDASKPGDASGKEVFA